jgi:hypothetical protein
MLWFELQKSEDVWPKTGIIIQAIMVIMIALNTDVKSFKWQRTNDAVILGCAKLLNFDKV